MVFFWRQKHSTASHRYRSLPVQHPYKSDRGHLSSRSIFILIKWSFIKPASLHLQKLSFHYMAPVAGGIANAHKNRFVFILCFGNASSPHDTSPRGLWGMVKKGLFRVINDWTISKFIFLNFWLLSKCNNSSYGLIYAAFTFCKLILNCHCCAISSSGNKDSFKASLTLPE